MNMDYKLTNVVAAIYNNLGNLELAQGNVEDAIDYYESALKIWIVGGDPTAEQLAVTYLCVARVHMLKGEYNEAMKFTQLSETLLIRTTGADMAFMAR